MLSILYAEVNIVGAAFLLFMLTNKNSEKFNELTFDQRIFNIVMLTNLIVLLFDTGMWLADGSQAAGLRTFNIFVTVVYYVLNPLMCMLCLMYADCKLYESRSGLLKRLPYYCIPAAISFVMTVLSPFTGWFFSISGDNRYTRGAFFNVMVFICFIYLLAANIIVICDIIKNGWHKTKYIDLPLLIFFTVIIAAVLLQVLYFGVSLIWITTALVCGYIYINLQNGVISTDYLTRLNNRRHLDIFLERRLQSWRGDTLMFAVILDLDGFKKINDVYGHMSGDTALSHTADILRLSCRKDMDFIARMGGDEFIIIGERTKTAEIDDLIKSIELSLIEFNNRKIVDYNLQISMGYSLFKKSDTAKSFMEAADREMYKIKQKKKADLS
ncbi:MAG: GGDEF domain-containing protein [Eubacteriales bacterium]|nr:GGDEF domain-containing protein [Eubacteriales bacterium]